MKVKYLCLFFLLITLGVQGQNLFNEKFDGCITDYFTTEKDSVVVRPLEKDIISVLKEHMSAKNVSKIKGGFAVQIIVDLEGKSCLISVLNETNISTSELNLKEIIDSYLFWEKPKEKTSVMISLHFKGNSVKIVRLGLSDKGINPIPDK